MPGHESLNPRSSVWDLIAVQLRILRQKHGWTGHEVGKIAGASRSHVSNWEAGRRRPSEKNLAPLDKAWETGELLTTLAGYAKDGYDRTRVGSFLESERAAESIKAYTSDHVFGLFQTEDYTRALFRAGGAVDDIEREVKGRLKRQRRLYEPNPPHLWVVLAQPVLWWQVGGPEVMRGQLAHLLETSELPHVSLRVLPVSSGWPGVPGLLSIMTTRATQVAYLEAGRMGKLIEAQPEVREYHTTLDGIGARALPEDQSRTLIEHMLGLLK